MVRGPRNFEIEELVRRVNALKERFTELRGHL